MAALTSAADVRFGCSLPTPAPPLSRSRSPGWPQHGLERYLHGPPHHNPLPLAATCTEGRMCLRAHVSPRGGEAGAAGIHPALSACPRHPLFQPCKVQAPRLPQASPFGAVFPRTLPTGLFPKPKTYLHPHPAQLVTHGEGARGCSVPCLELSAAGGGKWARRPPQGETVPWKRQANIPEPLYKSGPK